MPKPNGMLMEKRTAVDFLRGRVIHTAIGNQGAWR
jgi:hypothetical protein